VKNAVSWDVTPCGSCRNRRLARSVLLLQVTANVFRSSLILFILMMETILCYEMLVLARAAPRHIADDGILHSHSRENPKSYNTPMCCI
jgi:hypothetical protein